MTNRKISNETIRRLALYLRGLRNLHNINLSVISSHQIPLYLNISAEQFRKDLSYFGSIGKRGVGYRVDKLIQHLEKILGVDNECRLIVVGAGKLGSALISYPGFLNFNFRVVAAFDNDPDKLGKMAKDVKIENITHIGRIVKKLNVHLAILTVPADAAQAVAKKLVVCGIKAILNFAPVNLVFPKSIYIRNVDMATELMILRYFSQTAVFDSKNFPVDNE